MLVRSSSTPILDSWLPHSKDCSQEPEFHVLQRTKSISFSSSIDDYPLKKFTAQSFHEVNLQKPKKASPVKPPRSSKQPEYENISNDEKKEAKPSSRIQRLFSSSGLGENVVNDTDHQYDEEESGFQTLVVGGGMGSGDGGGGGGRGSDDGSEFYGNSNDGIEAYYQKMISADPGNALLLGNYAKFLKEVRGDFEKAEEYYGRAISANPNDGNILSLYAELVWEKDKDAQRAENYFDRAVKTAPQDCYVQASYARFLWDAEEEEEEEEEDSQHGAKSAPTLFNSQPHHPPLAAAS